MSPAFKKSQFHKASFLKGDISPLNFKEAKDLQIFKEVSFTECLIN